jgi:hypothetical protein
MLEVAPFTFLLVVYAVGIAQIALARLIILWTVSHFETFVGRAAQLVASTSSASPFAQALPRNLTENRASGDRFS